MKRHPIIHQEQGNRFHQCESSGIVYAIDKKQKMWSCHPFHKSKQGVHMKYVEWGWGMGDRIIRCADHVFNAEIYVAEFMIQSEIGKLCNCVGCIFRKDQSSRVASVRRLLLSVAELHKDALLNRHTGRFNILGWDPKCPICSRAIKVAERHGIPLPDYQRLDIEEQKE